MARCDADAGGAAAGARGHESAYTRALAPVVAGGVRNEPVLASGARPLRTPIARELLPLSLLERFAGDARDWLVATLRFLGPITTA